MHPLATSIARSPELFPHALRLEADAVNLVRLSEADYSRASFLDDRILARHSMTRPAPMGELEAAVAEAGLPERCNFIFHIGHVGSTLLSRLLGLHPAIFALREPAVLRTLAHVRERPETMPQIWRERGFERRLSCFLRLFSRTFDPTQQANIKATSFVSELAAEILARPSLPKAILLFAPAETYLATIFGGPNSRHEARILAEGRLNRLHRRLDEARWRLSGLSEGEAIAMSWACEMSALAAAAKAAPDRTLWVNFNEVVEKPAVLLAAAFRRFGVDVTDGQIGSIVSGPETRRYSKAPEHPYDAGLRRAVLEQARREHAREIARGLAWLDRARGHFSCIPAISGTG